MPDRHKSDEGPNLYPEGLEDALRRALDAEKGNGEVVEPMPETEPKEDSP